MKIKSILSVKPETNGVLDAGNESFIREIQIIEVDPLNRVVQFTGQEEAVPRDVKSLIDFPKAIGLQFPFLQMGVLTFSRLKSSNSKPEDEKEAYIYITGSEERFNGDFNKLSIVPLPNCGNTGYTCFGSNYMPKFPLTLVNDFFSSKFKFFELSSKYAQCGDYIQTWVENKKMPLFPPKTTIKIIHEYDHPYYVAWCKAYGKTIEAFAVSEVK
jgi:hypothetical protein